MTKNSHEEKTQETPDKNQVHQETPKNLSKEIKKKNSKPVAENNKKIQQNKIKRIQNKGFIGENQKDLAITDEEGNIYPTQIQIDGDDLIAYGDLIVGDSRFVEDYSNGDKTLTIPKPLLWPKGIVPYRYISEIPEHQKNAFKEIAKELKEKVGITFKEADIANDNIYVEVKTGVNNCYAQVGYTGKPTKMSLSPACDKNAIFHEVFHILGFFHQQNRFDRDDFLMILWENIKEDFTSQFEKFSQHSFPKKLQDIPFTYDTFMLYSPRSFSISQDYTIVTLDGVPYTYQEAPTQFDFYQLKILYEEELAGF